MSRRARARGFTLVEMLIAIAILAMISVLIYGAFSGMKHTKQGIERLDDRYREGRLAMSRMTRELQSAYLSLNAPLNSALAVEKTAFIGTTGSPADRVDFDSFSNRRLDRDSHESDQCEISYYGMEDPKRQGVTNLVRRISTHPDLYPTKGGTIEVLATDIDLFDLKYLDPLTSEWLETWDTTQTTGEPNRLPMQIKVTLVLNGGRRKAEDRAPEPIRFVSKVTIPIQHALNFNL
jgi:general secretion pathway protein J